MFAPANIIQPNRFTNCLLDRVYLRVRPNSNSVPVFQNNLMYGGQFDPDWPSHGAVTNIVFRDNLFDHFAGPNSFSYYHNMDHNAYVTNASFPPPTPVDTGDLLLSNSPAYQTGALGVFYQPTNSPLIDAGSDTVSNVGLAGFTTQTSQIPDTGTVDIGYHYATFLELTAQCNTNGAGVELQWSLDAIVQELLAGTAEIKGFNLYRATEPGGPYALVEMTSDYGFTTNYLDLGAIPGQTYYYVVTFYYYELTITGDIYESPYSDEVAITTCCPVTGGTNFWVDYGPTPLQLAQWLMGTNHVTVTNATYTGTNVARGIFGNGSGAGLTNMDAGVILSSGSIANAIGPNSSIPASTAFGLPGDTNLDSIINPYTCPDDCQTTEDAAILEFDILSSTNSISFQYLFASAEYPTFDSYYDDVCAIFVDGTNIALVPSTSEPISIYTVNDSTNAQFFLENYNYPYSFNIHYNGFTTNLTATISVSTNVLHHIKIAVADARDQALDSAIMLKAQLPSCP